MESYQSSPGYIVTSDSEEQCDVDAVKQRKTGARVNSQWKEFVVSKISVFGETNSTHRRGTPLPGGTEDVTSLKRTTVGALGVPLKISAPSLKISSEWNL